MKTFWSFLLVLTCVPLCLSQPIMGTDADNQNRTLNEPGRISVIISSTQDTQKQTRETGMLLDNFQGLKGFRETVVVDLRNSLGNLLPSFVRMQMRQNLDVEAKRIAPFFVANMNSENPRLYTRAIPDFDGKISTALGWPQPQTTVAAVVFDRTGSVAYRWTAKGNPSDLQKAVADLLKN